MVIGVRSGVRDQEHFAVWSEQMVAQEIPPACFDVLPFVDEYGVIALQYPGAGHTLGALLERVV